jgi:hypothetical protein
MQPSLQRSNSELWASFTAILIITLVYLIALVWLEAVPPASELFGHSLGIAGFLLMLSTETLYSIRKRSRRASWGRMSTWLNFHIFTGIVGPYMVLLHSSWKFNGLAGLTLLFTILIVISGFIGRYIYTAIPRNVEGMEMEMEWLEQAMVETRAELQRWLDSRPQDAHYLASRFGLLKNPAQQSPDDSVPLSVDMLLAAVNSSWLQRLHWRWALRGQSLTIRRAASQLSELLRWQKNLQRQATSLARSRRLFSLWHTIHIPIGLVLFTAAFIHIFAAIYYATLLN